MLWHPILHPLLNKHDLRYSTDNVIFPNIIADSEGIFSTTKLVQLKNVSYLVALKLSWVNSTLKC